MTRTAFVRWAAFNTVGLAGIAVQLAALALLTGGIGLNVSLATALAVETALLHNFAWHQRWTWRDRPSGSLRETARRLARFHALNGVVSLAGNVVLTTVLAGAGMHPVAANVIAIMACSLVNFFTGELLVFRGGSLAALVVLAALPATLQAQGASALDGWTAYTRAVEQRLAAPAAHPFFMLDARGVAGWRDRARAGEVPMVEIEAPGVDDGKIHQWAGAVYVPRTTVDAVVARVQALAGREAEFYDEVTASKLLERGPDRVRVFMKLQRDAGPITANYNTEHTVEYRRQGHRATARSVSTKIAELADVGTPREREKGAGEDHGFLWRLNAYWRYEQLGDGVLIECESVSLSRSVPLLVRPLVGPIANRIARESLKGTLVTLRKVLSTKEFIDRQA